MLEDQLLLAVVLEQYGVFVERANLPCQLDATDEVDSDWTLVLAHRVKKGVLNILCRL
jgi:hypothetical protein